MEFEVSDETADFDTVAYYNAGNKNNLQIGSMKKGEYEWDMQYKGKTDSAPQVNTSLEYYIDDSIESNTVLPVKIINQIFPDGIQTANGRFTTNVNSYTLQNWQTADDSSQSPWYFDYEHNDKTNEKLPISSSGPDLINNSAANLGNYGVTNNYDITIYNVGSSDRELIYNIFSEGFHIYAYKVYYNNDSEPAIVKGLTLKPAYLDMGTGGETEENVSIPIRANTTVRIELKITMTTGCNSTIHNKFIMN